MATLCVQYSVDATQLGQGRCPGGEEDEADLTWVKLDMSRTMLNMLNGAQEASKMRLTLPEKSLMCPGLC